MRFLLLNATTRVRSTFFLYASDRGHFFPFDVQRLPLFSTLHLCRYVTYCVP